MDIKTQSSSLTQTVYEQLRIMLLNGELRPGDKLKISDLCRSLDVNLSAVRESLSRLTSDGLVACEPQKGFRVAPISVDDLTQLTEARVQIESLCLSDSIKRGDLNWESLVIASQHRLLKTNRFDRVGKRINMEWAAAHSAFHYALVASCSNVWLLRMRATLATQGERYRWLSNSVSRMKRDLDKEHVKIAEASLQRNSDLAVKLVSAHFRLTAQVLLKSPFLQGEKTQARPATSASGRACA